MKITAKNCREVRTTQRHKKDLANQTNNIYLPLMYRKKYNLIYLKTAFVLTQPLKPQSIAISTAVEWKNFCCTSFPAFRHKKHPPTSLRDWICLGSFSSTSWSSKVPAPSFESSVVPTLTIDPICDLLEEESTKIQDLHPRHSQQRYHSALKLEFKETEEHKLLVSTHQCTKSPLHPSPAFISI